MVIDNLASLLFRGMIMSVRFLTDGDVVNVLFAKILHFIKTTRSTVHNSTRLFAMHFPCDLELALVRVHTAP